MYQDDSNIIQSSHPLFCILWSSLFNAIFNYATLSYFFLVPLCPVVLYLLPSDQIISNWFLFCHLLISYVTLTSHILYKHYTCSLHFVSLHFFSLHFSSHIFPSVLVLYVLSSSLRFTSQIFGFFPLFFYHFDIDINTDFDIDFYSNAIFIFISIYFYYLCLFLLFMLSLYIFTICCSFYVLAVLVLFTGGFTGNQ